jgi:flagellar hook-associated protein 1
MALNGALATASRALETFSTAVQISGQNIANANTPGYVREELKISSENPYQRGSLIIGTGSKAASVRQAIDVFLEKRIHTANSDAAAANARSEIASQLELELRELGENDLSTRLNKFVTALTEVANQPEQVPLRADVIAQGELLAQDIQNLRERLDRLRADQTTRIDNVVNEANDLIDQVADLNRKIGGLESNGLLTSQAGGLRTQRYDALNRLSEIIPITYTEGPNGSVDIYSGGDYVLLAGRRQELVRTTESDRGVSVRSVKFNLSGTEVSNTGGELTGVFQGRDEIIGGFIDELDKFTAGLIYEFNKLHSSGEGLSGFTTLSSDNKVRDSSAALSEAGLAFSPEHGSFDLKVTNARTGLSTTHSIAIDLDGIGSNDTTLEDLRASIDAVDGVSASITTDGRLKLDAGQDFEFRFADDTSGVLASLGLNTFFTGSSSASIGVNEVVSNNRNLFAAGLGGGPSDNRNSLELAQILEHPVGSLGNITLTDFYDSVVGAVATTTAAEQSSAEGFAAFRESLLSQREQFSGVSLDEEAIRLIEMQQAYAASARVISTVDDMFQILIGL